MLLPLPPIQKPEVLENRNVLKKLASARAALAELKGVAGTIPNEQILIDTLSLQEAKDSSAIENIVTSMMVRSVTPIFCNNSGIMALSYSCCHQTPCPASPAAGF